MRVRAIGLTLAAIGLILVASGLVVGSTERAVVERHSWQPRKLSLAIQPRSYVTIQLNGTRSYTYWRSLWKPEVRSTWGWNHTFYWDVNITSGRILFLQLSERDFKCWVEHEPRCARVEGTPTGGFGAYNIPWLTKEEFGKPVIVLINNSTSQATAEATVAEFWSEYVNLNVQSGLVLLGFGLTLSVTGILFLRKQQQPKGDELPEQPQKQQSLRKT